MSYPVLLPEIKNLPSSFIALVVIDPRSDPLSGSVKQAAGIVSPLEILGNQKSF